MGKSSPPQKRRRSETVKAVFTNINRRAYAAARRSTLFLRSLTRSHGPCRGPRSRERRGCAKVHAEATRFCDTPIRTHKRKRPRAPNRSLSSDGERKGPVAQQREGEGARDQRERQHRRCWNVR